MQLVVFPLHLLGLEPHCWVAWDLVECRLLLHMVLAAQCLSPHLIWAPLRLVLGLPLQWEECLRLAEVLQGQSCSVEVLLAQVLWEEYHKLARLARVLAYHRCLWQKPLDLEVDFP